MSLSTSFDLKRKEGLNRSLAAAGAGLLIVGTLAICEPIEAGQTRLAQQRQMVRQQAANPFNYEYVSASLGGSRSLRADELYFGDGIHVSVLNSGGADGMVEAAVIATDRGVSKVVKRSGVITVRPRSALFLEYTIPGGANASIAEIYWVRIKASNEFLLPRAKSVKRMPEGQGTPVRTIADYLPGDFAVFSTDTNGRIW